VYQKLAKWFVEKENHKYTDTYEKSLVYKSFIFKFLNSFVSPLYTAFILKDFEDLFFMLIGLFISRFLSTICFKIILKFMLYKYKKKKYFGKVNDKKVMQVGKQTKFDKGNMLKEVITFPESRSQLPRNYSSVFERTEDCLLRPILPVKKESSGMENMKFNIDEVEINSRSPAFESVLNFYSEALIQFGYITLFAAACPLAPIFGLIFNWIEIRLHISLILNCVKRPPGNIAGNIGPWLTILEFMSIVSVVSNALLVYISKESTLDPTFSSVEYDMIWLILLGEHCLFFLKYFTAALILDRPRWVIKEELRIKIESERITQIKDEEHRTKIRKVVRDCQKDALKKEEYLSKKINKEKYRRKEIRNIAKKNQEKVEKMKYHIAERDLEAKLRETRFSTFGPTPKVHFSGIDERSPQKEIVPKQKEQLSCEKVLLDEAYLQNNPAAQVLILTIFPPLLFILISN
jgi:hypothetical protein